MLQLRWNILKLADAVDARRSQLAEHRRRRRARVFSRSSTNPFRDIPEAEFVKNFRLEKETVKDLVQELAPFVPRPRRNDGISAETKVLIALAFYSTGSYQSLVGESALHNVSQISVSRAVRQVTEAINKLYHKYIKWPSEHDERNAIKAKFYQKFEIPGVLGCIDGTHIAIIKPQINPERYYNRKGFHSLNIMIICDSELNILCVDANNPGSADDSSVWHSHPNSQRLTHLTDNGEEVFLLGDREYALRTTMMTPILNTKDWTPQHNYNMKHVTAHNTVKCCLGILKARFRCLLVAHPLHYDPITAGKIVNACCILHNIANMTRATVPPLTPEEALVEAHRLQQDEHNLGPELNNAIEVQNPQNHRENRSLLEGQALQQALVERLWRNI